MYEKPRMKYVNLQNEEVIADECWALDGKNKTSGERFYDVEGDGYVGFWVKSGAGNCSNPQAYDIVYYEHVEDEGNPAIGSTYEEQIEIALSEAGGSNGQSYKGFDVKFPVAPKPEWS